MLHMCTFPVLSVFFHFLPSQGEKAQQVPGELRDAPAVLWVLSGPCGTGLGHCLSASAQMWQNLGELNLLRMQNSKKIFQVVFPSISAPLPSDWAISLLHPDTKHPPVNVGQEKAAQCRARLQTLKMY